MGLGLGNILRNDWHNGKWTRDFELGALDRSRALQKASSVFTNYSLDLVALQASNVTMQAVNQQMIMPFSNEKAMKVRILSKTLCTRQNYIASFEIRIHYVCITNQHDALFTFTSLHRHTSTCFGPICSRSSGGKMYTCGKWYLFYCWVISASRHGWKGTQLSCTSSS
jgi:hypothetical protein